MFNFDVKNGKKMSIRGMTCISFDGVEKINSKEYKYYYIDLIGNNGLGSTPAAAVKRRHKVSTKSGKDMIEYWKRYGKKKHFSFFKLKSMEDVIDFIGNVVLDLITLKKMVIYMKLRNGSN